VFRYRRGLIQKNMAICFPEKRAQELKKYESDFYNNLSMIILESIAAFSLSKKTAQERMAVLNPEVINHFFDQGKDVIITGGHYANWESATLSANLIKHDLYALYKPMKNKFMESKVKTSRCKFGVKMISVKEYRKYLEEEHKTPRAFLFGIDQSPRKSSGEWIDFLGRDTMVFTGPERLSKEYDLPVISGILKRKSKGQYTIEYKLLFEHPRETSDMEITKVTMKEVEDLVQENPGDWLWSHNRWKHTKSDDADA